MSPEITNAAIWGESKDGWEAVGIRHVSLKPHFLRLRRDSVLEARVNRDREKSVVYFVEEAQPHNQASDLSLSLSRQRKRQEEYI